MLALLLLAPAHGTDIGTERTLGMGATIGTVTGATGRVYFGSRRRYSIDFAFGLASDDDVYDALYGQVSAHRQFPLATGDGVAVPWRLGLGAFATSRGPLDGGGPGLGVRLPLGIDVDLERAPVQFSFEVSPLSVLVAPAVRYGLDAGVAVRYFL